MSSYFGTLNFCPSTIGTCPAQGAENKASSAVPACTLTGGSCGSSVLLSSGAFSFRLNLLSVSAINGVSWTFGLDYLAGNGIDDILGIGFNYTQNLRLVQIAGGVQLAGGGNTLDTFVTTDGGVTYTADEYNCTQAELTRSTSGPDIFTLTGSDGTVSTFAGFDVGVATPGRLLSVQDRYGNTQSYSWTNIGGVSQVTSLTDSYGRTINFSYYGPEFNYCLRQIVDFLGRQLNFQYDSFGHLVAIITPSINNAATGNTFPGGTAYVFQWDVDNPRPQRQNDLVKIFYPNQATPFIDPATRTVDVAAVYASAAPRYVVTYGPDPTDVDSWGLVTQETIGDPANGVGGTYQYLYNNSPDVTNLINPGDHILFECVVTDRNGNQAVYDFNAAQMPVRVEVMRNRGKINIPSTADSPSYVTWTAYNNQNQPTLRIMPEGNSLTFDYDDRMIDFGSGPVLYNRRAGLLLNRTASVTNPNAGLSPPYYIEPQRPNASSGQSQLTELFFYDPIFNQLCASIESRGNPIDSSGDYFMPQNGGSASAARYATLTYYDYQKNAESTIESAGAALLGISTGDVGTLIGFVSGQMSAAGLSSGFEYNLGDINGDGTGDGAGSDLGAAAMLGSVVKIKHPSVAQFADPAPSIYREEVFTSNNQGQETTHTDPNGNLTVWVRYPYNDPEGSGGITLPGPTDPPDLAGKQYGRVKEIHVDANPDDVLSLVGSDGDLVDFQPEGPIIPRPSTELPPLDLVTRFEGGAGAGGSGCAACAYDALGNPLAVTNPRGFTVRFDRNELGEVYRTISPQPYNFLVENYFDANRNAVRADTQDQQPAYDSADPTSARFGQFTPSGSGNTAHVVMRPGPGGSVRPGWFTNLYTFDILDDKTQEDIDATGSTPSSLVSTFLHDANENLIQITKPEGNIVEMDYDERNFQIATRVGRDAASGEPGAVTVIARDGNGNVLEIIGPASRGGTTDTVTIDDAFRSGAPLSHTGDRVLLNDIDGFDRVIQATDALENYVDTGVGYTGDNPFLDPDGRVIQADTYEHGTPDPVKIASVQMRFDEGGRQYETQRNVFVASNVTLASGRTITHDPTGCLATNSTTPRSGPALQIYPLSGASPTYVLSRRIFDPGGRAVTFLADNSQPINVAYDGANREILVTDALGNTIQNFFDPNGNLIGSLRTEYCSVTEITTKETFASAAYFDCLDQMVLQASQGADGNLNPNVMGLARSVSFWDMAPWNVASSTLISCAARDSRGNAVLSIDPKANSVATVVDGASRAIQFQQHLRWHGQGQNPPAHGRTLLPASAGTIVTTLVLDGNSRQVQLIDDRGNVTRWEFDTLDRESKMIFHDGSARTSEYDEASDVVNFTDENNTGFANTFDALSRKVSTDITVASGVSTDTQSQSFAFDGLSRTTFARNSNMALGESGTYADVNLFYDSINRVLEDSQTFGGNTRNVTNAGFLSYPVILLTFPNGRQISNVYDQLYRRKEVLETTGATNIALWNFFGPSRVAAVGLGNGLVCTMMNNAGTNSAVQGGFPPVMPNPPWVAPPAGQSADRLGYDGAGRMIAKRYLYLGSDTPDQAIVGFTTAFDRASNKFYERALHVEERSHLYEPFDSSQIPQGGYDSLDRLLQYQRGTLSATGGCGGNGGGSIATAITLLHTDQVRSYALDSLGNWRNTAFTPATTGTPVPQVEIRQHNGLNEITRISNSTISELVNPTYDLNGNLTNDDTLGYVWDALNRLVQVSLGETVIAAYYYDALNRRIRKAIGDANTDFVYLGWRCLEDRNPGAEDGDAAIAQYVWGIYLDELIQVKTYVSIVTNKVGGGTVTYSPGEYYPLQDLLYRTTATADSSGGVVEAYDFEAYGNTLIFNAAGTGGNWWADNAVQASNSLCQFLFTGQRFDAETGLYYYKRRYYSPLLGRFLSRNPVLTGPAADSATDLQINLDRGYNAIDGTSLSANPLGLGAGVNPYGYCRNNPTDRTDPSGLVDYGLYTGIRSASSWTGDHPSWSAPGSLPADFLLIGEEPRASVTYNASYSSTAWLFSGCGTYGQPSWRAQGSASGWGTSRASTAVMVKGGNTCNTIMDEGWGVCGGSMSAAIYACPGTYRVRWGYCVQITKTGVEGATAAIEYAGGTKAIGFANPPLATAPAAGTAILTTTVVVPPGSSSAALATYRPSLGLTFQCTSSATSAATIEVFSITPAPAVSPAPKPPPPLK